MDISLFSSSNIQLLDQIDLEPNIESIVLGAPLDRDHRYKIQERLPTLAVIDDASLNLRTPDNGRSQTIDSLPINKRALGASIKLAFRVLQKTTILPKDFIFGVACQPLEGLRTVHNGQVRPQNIAEHKSTRQVDCADIDLWVRPRRYSTLLSCKSSGKVPAA